MRTGTTGTQKLKELNCYKQGSPRLRRPLSHAVLIAARTFVLFPLDGFGSAVPSFQLCPVFGVVSSRVPSGNTISCFVGFGDKSWDTKAGTTSKTFFKLRALSFHFCLKERDGASFGVR